MKKNRIKAYWLLLLVLLYTAAAVLSVGEAQARYVTTATWNTVVQQEDTGVTSDCLVDIDGTPLTILLGTMPQEQYCVSFQLTAGEAASGSLKWTVNPPEYISVQMHIGDTVITPETTIELDAGETVAVMMTLIPSETAFTEVRDAVSVSVGVTWADTLKGTFLTQLPAVEEAEESTEETEPPTDVTEPPTDVTEPPTDVTEPPTDATEPPTDATEPPADVTEPTTETTEPSTEPGTDVTAFRAPKAPGKTIQKPDSILTPDTETPAGEDPTEAPTETEPEPSEEPKGQTEEPEDPQNPETPGGEGGSEEPGTGNDPEPTEPTEPVQEEVTILLDAPNSVNSAAALPLRITAPENGGAIHLGLAAMVEPTDPEGESQTVLEDFPPYTRFSLVDGENCYMLYHADTIPLNLADGETISLVLDLSHVNLEQFQVILGAAPQAGEAAITTYTATVIPEAIRLTSVSSRILSVGMPLEITVSEYWKDFTLEYTVEILTTVKPENGEPETLAYVPVELPPDCLLSEIASDETGMKLIFSVGQTLPPAGTYRVSLNWISEETCYAQMQETFFINYSLYTESEKTGGTEQ